MSYRVLGEKAGFDRPRLLNWFYEKDVRDFIFALRNKESECSILHLHGHHSLPQSIVLSDNDYTERYIRTFGTAVKLFAIFSTERVVFAGFSLNDPDLNELLREVNATMRPDEARHFAILGISNPKNEVLERNRFRKRFGVEPVFYNAAGGNHDGLREILISLESLISEQDSPGRRYETPRPDAPPSPPTSASAVIDPDDPEKGRWGGKAKSNHRELTAKVKELEVDWFEVTIEVRSTDKRHPLEGEVVFHLHPTLIPKTRLVRVEKGVATLTVESYGAYTVGVETDDRNNHLELDLSMIKAAPLMFRLN